MLCRSERFTSFFFSFHNRTSANDKRGRGGGRRVTQPDTSGKENHTSRQFSHKKSNRHSTAASFIFSRGHEIEGEYLFPSLKSLPSLLIITIEMCFYLIKSFCCMLLFCAFNWGGEGARLPLNTVCVNCALVKNARGLSSAKHGLNFEG